MAYVNNQQQPINRELVEEKYFALNPRQARPLIKQAVEVALGVELRELAPGMWVGRKDLDGGKQLEVTARAQPVEEGTSVELRLKHSFSAGRMTIYITALILLSMLILPMIAMIAYGQKQQEQLQQDALVAMHSMWGEIGEAVGAPMRSSYRDAPQRVYQPKPRRIETAGQQPEADIDQVAELEDEEPPKERAS